MTMDMQLTPELRSLFATAAATIAGGKHQFRVKDSDIKSESAAMVKVSRANRRKSAARAAYKWRNAESRFPNVGYGMDELARMEEWRAIIGTIPSNARMRSIARALFSPKRFETHAWKNAPESVKRPIMAMVANNDMERARELRAEYVASERERTLTNWRDTVRKYATIRDAAELVGAFPITNGDMRADSGSAFLNYARKHWSMSGFQTTIHGYSVEDALQDGFLSALESGHWIGRKHVPTYGHLWRHVKGAVIRAAWNNSGLSHHSDNSESWDWNEWAESPMDNPTIAEWAEYHQFRAMEDAMRATVDSIRAERESRMVMLSESRRTIAMLVNAGVSLSRIAHELGRTVDGLASDLTNEELAPPVRFLPRRPETLTESADRIESATRFAGHAHNLRTKHADMQADNYANGRVFRKGATGSVSVPRIVTVTPESDRMPGSVLSPGMPR